MKKLFTFLGAGLIATSSIAQSPFLSDTYNFNSAEKYAPGAITTVNLRDINPNQNRAVYYTEDFDAGFGSWVAAMQGGTVNFKLTDTGHDNGTGNSFLIPTLATTTPTQWVLVDSDKDGTSYADAENATLTSGVIDLTSSIGNFVAIEFEQFFAEWQPVDTEDHCYIAVTTDGGMTWDEVEINEGVGRDVRPNPELVSWDISNYILGAESTVQFRLRWEGAWNYGWQLDNIAVVDMNEKDISITKMWKNSFDRISFSQLPVAHTDTLVVGAVLKNIGHIDQTGVTFEYVVKDPTNAIVKSGTATDMLALTNSQYDTVFVRTDFVPTDLGIYTVELTAISVEGDDDLLTNVATDNNFELTSYTIAQDFNAGSVEEISSWPLGSGEAVFGILADFKVDDVVSGIDVKLTSHAVNVGEEIAAILYENNGTDGWTPLALTSHTITSNDLGGFVTIAFDGGFSVNATSLYFVGVRQNDTPSMPMFERQGNIVWDNLQGFDDVPDGRLFFDRKSPMVRIRVNAGEVSVNENVIANTFSTFPNPVNSTLNVSLNYSDSENTMIKVIDITGSVVSVLNLGTVNGISNSTISVETLSNGVYFIEVSNSNSKEVKKFVKH
jgi:hypothetical protein